MKKLIIILLSGVSVFLFSAHIARSQVSDDQVEVIAEAIKESDYNKIHEYLNDMVELTIPGNEGTFSKSQTKFILKEHFQKYPPVTFIIKHKGSSDNGALYAIGEYEHKNGKFRVYYLMKKKSEKYLIHILEFEKQGK